MTMVHHYRSYNQQGKQHCYNEPDASEKHYPRNAHNCTIIQGVGVKCLMDEQMKKALALEVRGKAPDYPLKQHVQVGEELVEQGNWPGSSASCMGVGLCSMAKWPTASLGQGLHASIAPLNSPAWV